MYRGWRCSTGVLNLNLATFAVLGLVALPEMEGVVGFKFKISMTFERVSVREGLEQRFLLRAH
jgi:hypothetical protein